MATKADDSVYFDLAMSSSANNAMQTIAANRAISVSEVLQRAVALFLEVEKARQDGQTVGILDADKKPVVEFVGF